ncbi:MAG: urease accessory protein UreD [Halarcobacter sp.]
MSISIEFKNNTFNLNKLNLPSRYFYFQKPENYIKLLSIGEGIFPKDRIKTKLNLSNSNLVLTTESATKVYASEEDFGINSINISLENSNLEVLNDELILFKNSKLLQFLNIKSDDKSTFFYSDILTQGRSYEHFDFQDLKVRNRFYNEGRLEYLENFEVQGNDLKKYIKRHDEANYIYLKCYIKLHKNENFLNILHEKGFNSFGYTKTKKIIIGTFSSKNMNEIKKLQKKIWYLYREALEKNHFDLGKQ